MRHIAAWIAGVLAVLLVVVVGVFWFVIPQRPPEGADPSFRIYSTPSLPSELTTAQAHVAVASLATSSLDSRIRSLFIVSKPGTDGVALQSFLTATSAGGFILMGRNIPATQAELRLMTSQMTGSVDYPRLIAIDEEGGDVTRLPYDTFPGANTLRFAPPADATAAFAQRANLLNQVGVNLNFGIVADIAATPSSFIYGRSFGSTALAAGERVAAAVVGEKKSPVLSTLKHFPGHGAAPGDSHSSIPSTTMSRAEWTSVESGPFKMGIQAGAPAVMFGHLAYTSVDAQPASLSTTWHQILRSELAFHGLAVTDDMLMLQRSGVAEFANPSENAIRALAAGNDVLLYVLGDDGVSGGVNIDSLVSAITEAVNAGRISEQRINEAALRTLTVRRGLAPQAVRDPQTCNIACSLGYSLLFPYSAHG